MTPRLTPEPYPKSPTIYLDSLLPPDKWWRGKDSNLRRRKPADLQSAPVGRLGTPPGKNEPRILVSTPRSVNGIGAILLRNCRPQEWRPGTPDRPPGRTLIYIDVPAPRNPLTGPRFAIQPQRRSSSRRNRARSTSLYESFDCALPDGQIPQLGNGAAIQPFVRATAQITGQIDITVSQAAQSTDLEALVLEQPAHFPIAAFVQADPKPGVAALGGFGLDAIEAGRPVLELNTPAQALEHRRPTACLAAAPGTRARSRSRGA